MIAFLAYGRRGRRFAVLGALGCLLLLAACGDVSEPRGPATADTGPNVLIYVVDTLRRDGLGVHAGAAGVSPRIDAIAREGVVFEDATAASSWTRASIATLLTGVSPPAHGAVDRRGGTSTRRAHARGAARRARLCDGLRHEQTRTWARSSASGEASTRCSSCTDDASPDTSASTSS